MQMSGMLSVALEEARQGAHIMFGRARAGGFLPLRTSCWLMLSLAVPRTITAVQSPGLTATGRIDLFESTRLEWRGIRRNARPVTEADAMAVAVYHSVNASVGIWTSLELEQTADEPRADLRAGPAGPTQRSLWGQLGYRKGGLSLTVGAIRDWFTRAGDDPATTEAFAAARLQAGRWSGSVSIWESLDGVEGAYLETALGFHHFVNPFTGPAVSWASGLRAGFQLSDRNPEPGLSVPGAEGTGFSHLILDSKVRATIDIGASLALVAATGPELRVNRDPATRRGRDGSEADVRVWWPVQAGFSWPLPRRQ